jgi:hypothetical protein
VPLRDINTAFSPQTRFKKYPLELWSYEAALANLTTNVVSLVRVTLR